MKCFWTSSGAFRIVSSEFDVATICWYSFDGSCAAIRCPNSCSVSNTVGDTESSNTHYSRGYCRSCWSNRASCWKIPYCLYNCRLFHFPLTFLSTAAFTARVCKAHAWGDESRLWLLAVVLAGFRGPIGSSRNSIQLRTRELTTDYALPY